MDRILFGDNQFFGINHMSEEKSRAQALRFKETRAIIDELDYVYSLGVNTFMCTTHARIAEICDHIRLNPDKYKDFMIYPCMPYAHKYANAVAETGIIGSLKQFLSGNIIGTVAKGGLAIAQKDFITIMKLLIDTEMKMFSGIKTGVIFLQNVVTDLLLGLGMNEVFVAFVEYVKEKYDAEAGFITMNMIKLLEVLEENHIHNPIICSSINKIGFRMSGGITAYEKTIQERTFRPIAMQILAAGAIKPNDAIDYICKQKNIKSILFGASTKNHIKQTVEVINQLSNN